MQEKPNYYGILPASVRYDKKVTAKAGYLYTEITALSNKWGFCIASNGYFAKLYDVSPITVSRWVSTLKKQGHIFVEFEKTASGNQRKIYPIMLKGVNKKVKGGKQKSKGGINKNVKHNNTVNNKLNNKSVKEEKETPTQKNVSTPPSSDMWTKLQVTLHNYKMPFSKNLNNHLLKYWKYMEEKKGHNWGTKTTILLQVDNVKDFLKKFTEEEIIASINECKKNGNVSYNPQWTKTRIKKETSNTYSFKNQTISNA